jgi:hypothetical protein
MESSGAVVGIGRRSSGFLIVQSVVRAVEDTKRKVGAGAVAAKNSLESVDRWVVGWIESCRQGLGCSSKVCEQQ